jgi:hypothetical protein
VDAHAEAIAHVFKVLIEGFKLYIVAGIVGITVAFTAWLITSHAVAASIVWAESRYPHWAGTKGMRIGEAALCGLVVLLCFALAFWVAHLIVK